jgi:hypothetical protein
MRFLAERIGRFSCRIEDARREWDLNAVVAERETVRQKQEQRRREEEQAGLRQAEERQWEEEQLWEEQAV